MDSWIFPHDEVQFPVHLVPFHQTHKYDCSYWKHNVLHTPFPEEVLHYSFQNGIEIHLQLQ